MRFVAMVIAALVLTGGSAPGAIRQALPPTATATAAPQWWRCVCLIWFADGRNEPGQLRWYGAADSVDWTNAVVLRSGEAGMIVLPWQILAGARIEPVGVVVPMGGQEGGR